MPGPPASTIAAAAAAALERHEAASEAAEESRKRGLVTAAKARLQPLVEDLLDLEALTSEVQGPLVVLKDAEGRGLAVQPDPHNPGQTRVWLAEQRPDGSWQTDTAEIESLVDAAHALGLG